MYKYKDLDNPWTDDMVILYSKASFIRHISLIIFLGKGTYNLKREIYNTAFSPKKYCFTKKYSSFTCRGQPMFLRHIPSKRLRRQSSSFSIFVIYKKQVCYCSIGSLVILNLCPCGGFLTLLTVYYVPS